MLLITSSLDMKYIGLAFKTMISIGSIYLMFYSIMKLIVFINNFLVK
jgi:hypothetical protein